MLARPLKFVLGDFTITRILDRYLEIDSPYNTYKYAGLPPGPIRMASIQVIDGVLNYQKHDYLYFCAKSDFSGYHYFSKTLRQHNAYAREYHRELDRTENLEIIKNDVQAERIKQMANLNLKIKILTFFANSE